jgi:hypothetical protein
MAPESANVMAVISDAFHLKQRVTEAFGIIRSKFIGPPLGGGREQDLLFGYRKTQISPNLP